MSTTPDIFKYIPGLTWHSTSESGTNWYLDSDTCKYLQRKEIENMRAWVVLCSNGYASRVLTYGSDIVYESQTLEAVTSYIDMLWLSRLPEKSI